MKYFPLIFLLLFCSCGSGATIKNFNYGPYANLNKERVFFKDHHIKEVIAYSYDIPYDTNITQNVVEKDLPFFKDSVMHYNTRGYLTKWERVYHNSQSYNVYFTYDDRGRLIKIHGGEEGEFKYSRYGNIIEDPNYTFQYSNEGLIIQSEEVDFSYSITGIKKPRITVIYIFDDEGRPKFEYFVDHHKFDYYGYSVLEYDGKDDLIKITTTRFNTSDLYGGDNKMYPQYGTEYFEKGNLINEIRTEPGIYKYSKSCIYENDLKIKEIDSNIFFLSEFNRVEYTEYIYNSNRELTKKISYKVEDKGTFVTDLVFFEYKYF